MIVIVGILKEHPLNVEQRLGNLALGLVDSMKNDGCKPNVVNRNGLISKFADSVNKAMVGTHMQ